MSKLEVNNKQLHGLDELFPDASTSSYETWKKAKNLVSEVEEAVNAFYGENINKSNLLAKLGAYYDFVKGDYTKALKYRIQALEENKKLLTSSSTTLALSYSNVGATYLSIGDKEKFNEGIENLKEALKINRELYQKDPSHLRDLLISLNDLGAAYTQLGNSSEAFIPLKEAHKFMFELPDNEENTKVKMRTLSNIGAACLPKKGQEHIQFCIDQQLEAIEMFKKAFDQKTDIDLIYPLYCLAFCYRLLGGEDNICKSLEYLLKTLKIYQEIYKEIPHPTVAQSLDNISLCLSQLGNLDEASRYTELAKNMREKIHQGDQNSKDEVSGLNTDDTQNGIALNGDNNNELDD